LGYEFFIIKRQARLDVTQNSCLDEEVCGLLEEKFDVAVRDGVVDGRRGSKIWGWGEGCRDEEIEGGWCALGGCFEAGLQGMEKSSAGGVRRRWRDVEV